MYRGSVAVRQDVRLDWGTLRNSDMGRIIWIAKVRYIHIYLDSHTALEFRLDSFFSL